MAHEQGPGPFLPGWTSEKRPDPHAAFYLPDLGLGPRLARGAKGWRRPDARILDEVSERIALCGADASDVEIRVEDGVVTLAGTARSREDRRLMEEVASEVFGVEDVYGLLRVSPDRDRAGRRPPGEPH
jgi:hypothetical protein